MSNSALPLAGDGSGGLEFRQIANADIADATIESDKIVSLDYSKLTNVPTINSDFSTITNTTEAVGIPHLNGPYDTTFTKIVNADLDDNTISGAKLTL